MSLHSLPLNSVSINSQLIPVVQLSLSESNNALYPRYNTTEKWVTPFISDTNVSGHMLYNVFNDFFTSNQATDEKVRLKIEHNQ